MISVSFPGASKLQPLTSYILVLRLCTPLDKSYAVVKSSTLVLFVSDNKFLIYNSDSVLQTGLSYLLHQYILTNCRCFTFSTPGTWFFN